jgi:hypothetical protein
LAIIVLRLDVKVTVIVGEVGRRMRNDGDRYYEAWKSVTK